MTRIREHTVRKIMIGQCAIMIGTLAGSVLGISPSPWMAQAAEAKVEAVCCKAGDTIPPIELVAKVP